MSGSPNEPSNEPEVACGVLVYRVITKKGWINPDTGEVLPDAYIPRENGRDDQGLSVSIAPAREGEELLDGAVEAKSHLNKPRGVATLHVGWVRNIGLDVCRDPEPENPDHALILGVPRRDANKREAERLAGQLARISRIVWPFPEQ